MPWPNYFVSNSIVSYCFIRTKFEIKVHFFNQQSNFKIHDSHGVGIRSGIQRISASCFGNLIVLIIRFGLPF